MSSWSSSSLRSMLARSLSRPWFALTFSPKPHRRSAMPTAAGKWPASARLWTIAPAGHLPTALAYMVGTTRFHGIFRGSDTEPMDPVERCPRFGHPWNATICSHPVTGPCCRPQCHFRTLEQRPDRRADQPAQDAECATAMPTAARKISGSEGARFRAIWQRSIASTDLPSCRRGCAALCPRWWPP